jgi:hypothetical protein
MGDTGSMLLGLLLAYAPISAIPSLDPAVLASHINRYPVIMPLLLPAALLVIPYADLLLAVVRRTRAGQSPFAPDRKHLHHRLLDIGHSQRASVLIMYLWAAVFSGSVVWLSLQRTQRPGGVNHHGHPVLVFVAITAAAVVVLLLMSMPKLRQWGRSARLDEAAARLDEAAARLDDSRSKLAGVTARAGLAAAALKPTVLESTVLESTALESPALDSAGLEPAAAELRPPAAAPVAATGSAEPQLVAAAAVSRTLPLGAPAPNGGSTGRATPAPGWVDRRGIERERAERVATTSDWVGRDWADPGWTRPEWVDPDWVSPAWVRRDDAASGWPTGSDRTAADPPDVAGSDPERGGPAAGWTFGDRRGSDREPSDWRAADDTPSKVDDAPSQTAPFNSGRSGSYRPASPTGPANGASAPGHVSPGSGSPGNGSPGNMSLGKGSSGPAHGGRPQSRIEAGPAGNGDVAARSIIGTPPPAVTSLGTHGTPSIDSNDLDPGDAEPPEL